MLYMTVLSDKEEAKFRYEESKRYYDEWGAIGKVKLLEFEYETCFVPTVASEIICEGNSMLSGLQTE